MQEDAPAPADRRTAILDAAIEVLSTEGGRGLTHRAIDRRLDLPLGSTANHFSTRDALLRAVTDRLLELVIVDLEPIPERRLSKDRAAGLIVKYLMDTAHSDARHRYIAHQEVLLQSARDHHLQIEVSAARQRVVDVVTRILVAAGCDDPKAHAPGLIALIDGLLIDQLLYSSDPVDSRWLNSQVKRYLAHC